MRYALAVLFLTMSVYADCVTSVFPEGTKSLEYVQTAKSDLGEIEAKLVWTDRRVHGKHVRWTETFTKESGSTRSISSYLCSDEGMVPTDEEGTTFTGVQYGSDLTPGKSWTWTFEGGGVSAEYTYTVMKIEKVTVPAGTFDAARVDYTATAHSETRGNLGKLHGSLWIADGIGLVKQFDDDPALGIVPDQTTLVLIARK